MEVECLHLKANTRNFKLVAGSLSPLQEARLTICCLWPGMTITTEMTVHIGFHNMEFIFIIQCEFDEHEVWVSERWTFVTAQMGKCEIWKKYTYWKVVIIKIDIM